MNDHEFVAELRKFANDLTNHASEYDPLGTDVRAYQLLLTAATKIELWMDRYESERRDHEATIKHADKMLSRL